MKRYTIVCIYLYIVKVFSQFLVEKYKINVLFYSDFLYVQTFVAKIYKNIFNQKLIVIFIYVYGLNLVPFWNASKSEKYPVYLAI